MIRPSNSLPDLTAVAPDDLGAAVESLRLIDGNESEPASAEPLQPLLERVLAELRSQRHRNSRVVVKTGGKVLFLRAEAIEWVEAAGNYVRLHVGRESYLFRESMKNMESRLDGDQFVRIHRSAIVNVDHIRELQPWFHGEYVVMLHDGTRLMASRVFADRLDRLIA